MNNTGIDNGKKTRRTEREQGLLREEEMCSVDSETLASWAWNISHSRFGQESDGAKPKKIGRSGRQSSGAERESLQVWKGSPMRGGATRNQEVERRGNVGLSDPGGMEIL